MALAYKCFSNTKVLSQLYSLMSLGRNNGCNKDYTKLSICIHIHRLDKEIFFEFSLKKLVYERIEVALFSKIPISGIFPFIFTPSLTPTTQEIKQIILTNNCDASLVMGKYSAVTMALIADTWQTRWIIFILIW